MASKFNDEENLFWWSSSNFHLILALYPLGHLMLLHHAVPVHNARLDQVHDLPRTRNISAVWGSFFSPAEWEVRHGDRHRGCPRTGQTQASWSSCGRSDKGTSLFLKTKCLWKISSSWVFLIFVCLYSTTLNSPLICPFDGFNAISMWTLTLHHDHKH